MPYLYSVFYESTQNGMPVARSLAIGYTHDDKIYEDDYQNQYLFGSAILVAPVESYKEYARVYLPEGTWYDLFDDKRLPGNSEMVYPVNKEILPLFIKAGSIIPMQTSVNSLMKERPAETLELHVYLGADGTFSYYEDDGTTYAYEQGAYYKRNFIYNEQKKQLQFSAKEGTYTSHFKKVRIYFHGLASNAAISQGGSTLKIAHQNYRFIEPISDFDPYHVPPKPPTELQNLSFVEVELADGEMMISIA
jgi:alpha-glucosidase